LQRIQLERLLTYAQCPLRYWWRYRAHIEAPVITEELPRLALQQGLRHYYEGRAASLVDGCLAAWQAWADDWRCPPETPALIARYVRMRAQRHDEDLPVDELREAWRDVTIPSASDYDLPAALDDTVLAALRYVGPECDGQREVLLDWPFQISLTAGITVEGLASLVVLERDQVTVAEFHGYSPYCPSELFLSRHLSIVALANAEGTGWRGEWYVVYRHMLTGFSASVFTTGDADRLLPVISATLRGIECGVFLPRMAATDRECLRCPYRELCTTPDGLDALDDLDATLVAASEEKKGS